MFCSTFYFFSAIRLPAVEEVASKWGRGCGHGSTRGGRGRGGHVKAETITEQLNLLDDDPQTLLTDEIEEEEVTEIKQEKREQQTAHRGKLFKLTWSAKIRKITHVKKCSVKLEKNCPGESPKKKEKKL